VQLTSNEKGQALPIVLVLLVLGGLTVASSLNYTTTSLIGSRVIAENVNGAYAADAGVEDTLWSLGNGMPPPLQLTENINQMEVNIQTEVKGIYTVYLGELIIPGEHFNYLDVEGEMVWDEEADAYKYTIMVIWQPESGYPVIHLVEIGVRLPLGYTYQPGSAAIFTENPTMNEPEEIPDTLGAWMLNWELGTPEPSVSEEDPVLSQTFYVTGEGELEGDYSWIVANRDDVGAVGEITGNSYRITATATRSGDGVAASRISTNVMVEEESTYILTWQILN
jgi:hypothetical protein